MTKVTPDPRYPMSMTELPPGWLIAYVGDVISDVSPGFASGKHNAEGRGVPHLRPMNISRDGEIDLVQIKSVARDTDGRRLQVGDVLFNNTNSPTLIGKTAVMRASGEFAFSNHMTRLRPPDGIVPRFLAKQLHYLWMSGYFLHRCTHHVNQASIASKTLAQTVPILIAPTDEQERIADAIDELLTDLDAGVAALERVQRNLERYRASVLKAAVEGKLTEDWRAEHSDVEPADEQLKRILVERRERWEADQLAKYKAKGKTPPRDWKSRYKEPAAPNTANLPALLDGWTWTTVSQCSHNVQYGTSARCSQDESGVPVLRMGNIRSDGGLDLSALKYLPQSHDDLLALLLQQGDLLFNRTNSAELVGKTAVYDGLPKRCSFASYLIRVQVLPGVRPHYVAACLNSGFGRQWIKTVVNQTVGQANVNGTKLSGFTFPLPPEAEQDEIVSLIDEIDSAITAVGISTEKQERRATRLRQSILKRAFEGKLVPQDPNDEPASVLLARIQQEREAQAAQAKATKRRGGS